MKPLYAPAYAKVNLSLDVCGVREDGYHLLRSVFQQISLKDDLWAEPAKEITIRCDAAGMPPPEKNIIYRTARAFFDYVGLQGHGVSFRLNKHIPSGAGLGGGSADGVAALRLLNEMYQTRLTREQMVQIVAPIGADLPFFVYGGTALCEGVGEKVTPLPPLHKGAFLLLKPDVFMSTPQMFGVLDGIENPLHPDVDRMVRAVQAQDPAAIGAAMGNSLQSAGASMYDFIDHLCEKLTTVGALGAMLSGSGSTVFGVFSDEASARRAARVVDASDCFIQVVVPVE